MGGAFASARLTRSLVDAISMSAAIRCVKCNRPFPPPEASHGFHGAPLLQRDRAFAFDQGGIGAAACLALRDQPADRQARARAACADLRPSCAGDDADRGRRDPARQGRGRDARVLARQVAHRGATGYSGGNGRRLLLPDCDRKLRCAGAASLSRAISECHLQRAHAAAPTRRWRP